MISSRIARADHPLRVLVVDDDPTVRAIADAAYRARPGCEVLTVGDPLQAVETALAFAPDLILLDHRMEGMDGDELLLHMQAEPALARLPVVFLTSSVEHRESFLERGASGVIAKPFTPDRLPDLVDEILRRRAFRDRRVAATEMAGEGALSRFLAEGRDEARLLLDAVEGAAADKPLDEAEIADVAHGWIGLGGTLGHPDISAGARELYELALAEDGPELRRRLGASLRRLVDLFQVPPAVGDPATWIESSRAWCVPRAIPEALSARRVGIVGFGPAASARLEDELVVMGVHATVLRWAEVSPELLASLDAILLHAASLPAARERELLDAGRPVLLVGASTSLPDWTLTSLRYDFVHGHHEPEEILLRLHRLLVAPACRPTAC